MTPSQILERALKKFFGNKTKGRISKRKTRTCAYQGVRNVRFSENLACFVFLFPLSWDSRFCLITDEICFFNNKSQNFFLNILQDHPFNTYTKFFKTLLFLTPYYAPVGVSIWGSEILVFRKILRMYNMDDLRIEYSTHYPLHTNFDISLFMHIVEKWPNIL